jgi:hypothetical protein
MDLLPSKALIGIAKAMTYGARKYSDYNFKKGKGLEWRQPYAALMRHMVAFWDGEDIDPESGLPHIYHIGACAVMLIDLIDSNRGKDTRFT